jgi:uncharacterized protein
MRIFVDTSAWFALRNRRDENHERAVQFLKKLSGKRLALATSDFVLDETVTLLRMRLSHADAVAFLDLCHENPRISIFHAPVEVIQQAESIFRRFSDKTWSFTDCVSFVCMDQLRIDSAFAFDRHFREYGKSTFPE